MSTSDAGVVYVGLTRSPQFWSTV